MATPKKRAKPVPVNTTKPKAIVAAPKVPVDDAVSVPAKKARAQYDRYHALVLEIADASRDEVHGWDRRWEAIATILQKSYYLFDDETPNAPAWLKKHTTESYRTALRNARVAQYASPAEIEKYGATKLDLALSIELALWQKKHGDAPDEKTEESVLRAVKFAKLRYQVKRAAKSKSVTLAELTAEELRGMLRESTRQGKPVSVRLSASGQKLVAALKSEKSLQNIKVSEHDSQLTLAGVRIDQMSALADVLALVARK